MFLFQGLPYNLDGGRVRSIEDELKWKGVSEYLIKVLKRDLIAMSVYLSEGQSINSKSFEMFGKINDN